MGRWRPMTWYSLRRPTHRTVSLYSSSAMNNRLSSNQSIHPLLWRWYESVSRDPGDIAGGVDVVVLNYREVTVVQSNSCSDVGHATPTRIQRPCLRKYRSSPSVQRRTHRLSDAVFAAKSIPRSRRHRRDPSANPTPHTRKEGLCLPI